jgi:hypothetical protein
MLLSDEALIGFLQCALRKSDKPQMFERRGMRGRGSAVAPSRLLVTPDPNPWPEEMNGPFRLNIVEENRVFLKKFT